MKNIEFKIGIVPKTSEIIEVYDSSGIKRPTKDSDRITKMYKNSNLIITAWLNNELRRLIRKRKRLYKKSRHTNSPVHWENFRHLRNQIIAKIRESKRNLLDKIANNLQAESRNTKTGGPLLNISLNQLAVFRYG